MNNIIDIEQVNKNATTNLSSLILESENNFTNQIANICKMICNDSNKKIVLLAGPSASGKTTTSSLLALHLGMLGKKVTTVSLDNFFLSREQTPILPDGSYDFENVHALDLPCLNNFINDLIRKKSANMPIFNFLTGRRDNYERLSIDENTIIIFEGLHALNPLLINNNYDKVIRLYINPSSDFVLNNKIVLTSQDLRLLRRITRDYYNRGANLDKTLDMWQNVLNGEEIYIKPFQHNADFVINSTHSYEPLLYANYTQKIFNKFNNEDSKHLEKIKLLEQKLTNFKQIDKKLLPSTSLLWEFVNAAE